MVFSLAQFRHQVDHIFQPIFRLLISLIISQFTLFANTRKGRRPSFIESAKSENAKRIYDEFIDIISKEQINIKTGIFGAKMLVQINNDGPVTISMDSR